MPDDRGAFRAAPLAATTVGGALITYWLLPGEIQAVIPGGMVSGVVGLCVVYLVVLSAPLLWLFARLEQFMDRHYKADVDKSQSHDTSD